jgi:hypothetical protein
MVLIYRKLVNLNFLIEDPEKNVNLDNNYFKVIIVNVNKIIDHFI